MLQDLHVVFAAIEYHREALSRATTQTSTLDETIVRVRDAIRTLSAVPQPPPRRGYLALHPVVGDTPMLDIDASVAAASSSTPAASSSPDSVCETDSVVVAHMGYHTAIKLMEGRLKKLHARMADTIAARDQAAAHIAELEATLATLTGVSTLPPLSVSLHGYRTVWGRSLSDP